MPRFVRTTGHGVHLVSPMQGGEFTLCGIAFDAGDSEKDSTAQWRDTPSTTVTCDICIDVIEACQGIKVRRRA